MEGDYYSKKLSAHRLKRVYDIATPRVRQYLEAEVKYVVEHIRSQDRVLELGCGYGRILPRLAEKAAFVVGIDTSHSSLVMGREMIKGVSNCWLVEMNAVRLAFGDRIFDLVVCIQNGISAFHVNQRDLMRESIRVEKSGALLLFSSYSENFWGDRLEWFRLQSQAGLLGDIDYGKTGNGVIVCKDGFDAKTVNPEQFIKIVREFNMEARIVEVDGSSLFCEIIPGNAVGDISGL